jgi:hypothetical protein
MIDGLSFWLSIFCADRSSTLTMNNPIISTSLLNSTAANGFTIHNRCCSSNPSTKFVIITTTTGSDWISALCSCSTSFDLSKDFTSVARVMSSIAFTSLSAE